MTIIRTILVSQYGAALSMLHHCVRGADAVTWQTTVGRFPFWHVTYHTLYFADLYLSRDEQSFCPPPFHREGYNWLGVDFSNPANQPSAVKPYDQETMLAYVGLCRAKAKRVIEQESEASFAGCSGFSWLAFTRLEMHLYNIRHIQHHTGQLSAALRLRGNAGVEWVSSEPICLGEN